MARFRWYLVRKGKEEEREREKKGTRIGERVDERTIKQRYDCTVVGTAFEIGAVQCSAVLLRCSTRCKGTRHTLMMFHRLRTLTGDRQGKENGSTDRPRRTCKPVALPRCTFRRANFTNKTGGNKGGGERVCSHLWLGRGSWFGRRTRIIRSGRSCLPGRGCTRAGPALGSKVFPPHHSDQILNVYKLVLVVFCAAKREKSGCFCYVEQSRPGGRWSRWFVGQHGPKEVESVIVRSRPPTLIKFHLRRQCAGW